MKIIDTYRTLVIGSGCAGYGAADCLWNRGVKNIALLTENRVYKTSFSKYGTAYEKLIYPNLQGVFSNE